MSRASVIITTYNRERMLDWTLAALCRQTVDVRDFEVIVVDDGSGDGTATIVDAHTSRLDLTYLYQDDAGYRVSRARNLGLARASGETVVLLDTGVLPGSGWLAAHLRHRRSIVIGYLWGYMRDDARNDELARAIDTDDVDATIATMSATGNWLDVREEAFRHHGDRLDDLPAPWLFFWTGNVSAPLDAIRSVGGFDERYRSWGLEDFDVGIALHELGLPFRLEREAAAVHYPHPRPHGPPTENLRYFQEKFPRRAAELLSTHRGTDINRILQNEMQRDEPNDVNTLPGDLPVPLDDGACDHLPGRSLPSLALPATAGEPVDLGAIAGRVVVYVYPMTGRPDRTLPDGWDALPGARGCTPQSCAFRDHAAEIDALGARLYGLSTQDTTYQREAAARLHLPFALLSDASLDFARALELPTFPVDGMTLLKRVTLIATDGVVEKVFYPVFPPDRNADDVVAWLTTPG